VRRWLFDGAWGERGISRFPVALGLAAFASATLAIEGTCEMTPGQTGHAEGAIIRYWTNAGDDAHPTELTIDVAAQRACLVERSNRGDAERAAIGIFDGPVDRRRVVELSEALRSSPFAALPQDVAAEPGQVIRILSRTDPEGGMTRRSVTGTAPHGFAHPETLAQHIRARLHQHPRRAVALDFVSLPSRHLEGHAPMLELTLTNPGERPVRLRPAEGPIADGWVVTVEAVRSDIPREGLRSRHQFFGQVTGIEMEAGNGAEAREDRLMVPPGGWAALRGTVDFNAHAGRYTVRTAVAVELCDEDGKGCMSGELLSRRHAVYIEPDDGE